MADIYGKIPRLTFRNKHKFHTGFGCLLTLISFVIITSCTIYFSLDLFNHLEPKIVHSLRNVANPAKFEFSTETYGFAFGLENPATYNQFIDESIYKVKVSQLIARRNTKGDMVSIYIDREIEPCTLSKFPNLFHNLMTFSYGQMYCLKNTSFSLQGTFLNDLHTSLRIKIYECQNSTDTQNHSTVCKSKEEIDSYLTGTYFTFASTDITVDQTNYTYPNQNYFLDSYTSISNKYYKQLTHYLKLLNIETDKGWLFPEIYQNVFMQTDYIQELMDFRSMEYMLLYELKLSTIVENYSRSYKKIQNLAAEVGGIIKIVTFIGWLLSYLYNNSEYTLSLIEELFEYDSPDSFDQLNFNKIPPERNLSNPYLGNKLNHQRLNNMSISEINKIGIQNINQEDGSNKQNFKKLTDISSESVTNRKLKSPFSNHKIKLSFLENFSIFTLPFCHNKNKPKYKLFFIASNYLKERTDILNILKLLYDVERLKQIILDHDQLKLFNLPYKYYIGKENKINRFQEFNIGNLEEIKTAYNNILFKINNNVQQETNRKIIKTLSSRVKSLLNIII